MGSTAPEEPSEMRRHGLMTSLTLSMACSAVAAAGPFSPGGNAAPPAAEDLVHARMIAGHDGFRPGAATDIALTFDIHPGWHLYWANPGDTGMQVMIELELPDGFTAGDVQWPAPMRYIQSGLLDYIHEDELTLIIPVTAPADAQPGADARISARLDWLVCKDVCLPGGDNVSLTLPVRSAEPAAATGDIAERLDRARARHPRRPGPDDGIVMRWTEGTALAIRARGADEVLFFPLSSDKPNASKHLPLNMLSGGHVRGDSVIVRYRPEIRDADRVAGVLEVRRDGASSFFTIETPAPGAAGGSGGR